VVTDPKTGVCPARGYGKSPPTWVRFHQRDGFSPRDPPESPSSGPYCTLSPDPRGGDESTSERDLGRRDRAGNPPGPRADGLAPCPQRPGAGRVAPAQAFRGEEDAPRTSTATR